MSSTRARQPDTTPFRPLTSAVTESDMSTSSMMSREESGKACGVRDGRKGGAEGVVDGGRASRQAARTGRVHSHAHEPSPGRDP